MELNLGLFSIVFLTDPLAFGLAFTAKYSVPLIIVSYLFAAAGAYVGLLISAQVRVARNNLESNAWLAAGATAMGAGIWSMHFVGMVAYELPMAVHYGILLTLLSIIPSVAASFLALKMLSKRTVSAVTLAISSVFMGAGIGAMHYMGMGAMHVGSAMAYDPWLFATSIVVAVLFAFVALSAKARLKNMLGATGNRWVNPISAGIMGIAISGMHYTAMSAVRFYPGAQHGAHSDLHGTNVDSGFLLILINALVFLLIFLVFVAILARKIYANQSLQEAQKALAETEDRWNIALRGSGQGVWDCNVETGETFYSPTWRNMRGIEPNEKITSKMDPAFENVHPEDRERVRETTSQQEAGRPPYNFFEYREKHRDGHYIWIQSRGEPASYDAEGRPNRIIGIDIDISQRKELELQVSDNLKLLHTTLENFPGGIAMFDKDLVLTVASQGYYEITQLDESWYPIGSKLSDILLVHAERGDYGDGDPQEIIAKVIADAKSYSAKVQQRPMPLTGQTLEYTRSPLEEGGFVLTVEDVTAKLAAEKQRVQLERDLSQSQKMESLGTLASGVAHEINTPIQYIGDNIRFLQESFIDLVDLLGDYKTANAANSDAAIDEKLTSKEEEIDLDFLLEELPQSMSQSLEGIGQVARIVNAIKEFSHPGQDEMAAIDLNNTIETTLTVSRNQWKYIADVTTNLSAELPAIHCYQGDINQVILNMVVNAAHAIEASGKPESGQIEVTTQLVEGFVEIEIKDNGSGMSEDVQERIFDPFFTTKDIGKGTGQGLAISYAIICQKHNGSIKCFSEVGEGTKFTISLPLVERDQPDEQVA